MSIFDVEEYIARPTLQGTTVLIYGQRKIGKTSLAVQYPKAFIAGFEIGWKGLNRVKAQPVKDWSDFKKNFVKPLVKQGQDFNSGKLKEKTYETIIIDTTDIAWEYCYNYICSKEGVTHLDYTENKRGYKMLRQEFLKQMFALLGAGYTVVFTSHAESKQTVNEITKEKEEKIIPTMDKNAFKIIGGVVDAIVYCANVEDKEGNMRRLAYFRTNGNFEAGSRWSKYLPIAVDLNYKDYESAIIEAIRKKAEEDGVDCDKQADENLYKLSQEDYDYDAMMEEVNRIGKFLMDKDRLDIMNDLSDEMLGVGNKISQCTKLQVEMISNYLDEIKDKMEEAELDYED